MDATELQPSEHVVQAIAARTDEDPLELSPLYEAVDPDALDALFGGPAREGSGSVGKVRFVYEGYEVTVHADGTVDLEEASAGRGRPEGKTGTNA